MVKSLFNFCLSALCQHELNDQLAALPTECKQRLLEFFTSHDQLRTTDANRLITLPQFGCNLTRLNFYLSDELSDDLLVAIARHNRGIEQITIVHCPLGIRSLTKDQHRLRTLELRGLKNLTSYGIYFVESPVLHTVDLSSCTQVTSEGLIRLVARNHGIRTLYLNNCLSLDDHALYAVGRHLSTRLTVIELDFLPNLIDPSTTLYNLSCNCPNIKQLSLCRFFQTDGNDPFNEYRIGGLGLQELDLHGNYLPTLPLLPESITSIRLSVCGDENVTDLINGLNAKRQLTSIRLQISCRETDNRSVEEANRFLCLFLPLLGVKVTRLHISLPRLGDSALMLIAQCCPRLSHLALDVKHASSHIIRRFFAPAERMPAADGLRSLKLCRLRISYRALFAIARGARQLVDLETSHMPSVDDRFLSMVAENCRQLKSVNFNGCHYVGDKGLAALARRCSLREIRIRGTSVTDKCVYILAQFCPDLEWIAHADQGGRPKFSDQALQCLRDSCVQRVIC